MGIHRHPEINKYVASRVNAGQRSSTLRNQYWLAVIHSWSITYTGFFSCYISLCCIYGGTWMMWNPHEIKLNWSQDNTIANIYIYIYTDVSTLAFPQSSVCFSPEEYSLFATILPLWHQSAVIEKVFTEDMWLFLIWLQTKMKPKTLEWP